MNKQFKDHFSSQSSDYARYRPQYPDELYLFLSNSVLDRAHAWDCATGNGQAALGLAKYFDHVTATDASAQQVQNAQLHPKIEYRVAHAENCGFPSCTFDLVTVATAAHWLDLERFYTEVVRVLKPGGLLALWTYGGSEEDASTEVGRILNRFAKETVGPYFPSDLQKVRAGYQKLNFPFQEVPTPQFTMRVEWSLTQLIGYLGTWSATQRFIESRGFDPREQIYDDLKTAIGASNTVTRHWPIDLRLGRVRL